MLVLCCKRIKTNFVRLAVKIKSFAVLYTRNYSYFNSDTYRDTWHIQTTNIQTLAALYCFFPLNSRCVATTPYCIHTNVHLRHLI